MRHSMTGFASDRGSHGAYSWVWDIRAVNGKGLDLRLRLPDWVEGLEAGVRKAVSAVVARGNVSVTLRINREESEVKPRLNTTQLSAMLSALNDVEAEAKRQGATLAPSRASDLLALRGVLDTSSTDDEAEGLNAALMAQFTDILAAFQAARAAEGAALAEIMTRQVDEIDAMVTEATGLLEARAEDNKVALKAALQRVLDTTDAVDEPRLAQELAMIAVKADVTEELDRLRAHVVSARSLLTGPGAAGRKLDFLLQEFNREANTLCSKANHPELTRVGLALKVVIDQMREQAQNLE